MTVNLYFPIFNIILAKLLSLFLLITCIILSPGIQLPMERQHRARGSKAFSSHRKFASKPSWRVIIIRRRSLAFAHSVTLFLPYKLCRAMFRYPPKYCGSASSVRTLFPSIELNVVCMISLF